MTKQYPHMHTHYIVYCHIVFKRVGWFKDLAKFQLIVCCWRWPSMVCQSRPCCMSVWRSLKAAPRRPCSVCRLSRNARTSSNSLWICMHFAYRSSRGISTPNVCTGAITLARTTDEKLRTISLSALQPHCMYLGNKGKCLIPHILF